MFAQPLFVEKFSNDGRVGFFPTLNCLYRMRSSIYQSGEDEPKGDLTASLGLPDSCCRVSLSVVSVLQPLSSAQGVYPLVIESSKTKCARITGWTETGVSI